MQEQQFLSANAPLGSTVRGLLELEPRHQNVTLAVNVSANLIFVKGRLLYQTWRITIR